MRAGLTSVEKNRFASIRRFGFQSRGPLSGDVQLRRNPTPDDILFDETIDPRGWQLNEVTIPTDAYTADQTLEAWYAGLDFSFGDWLRLGGGLRSERSDQSVVTFDIFNEGGDPVVIHGNVENRGLIDNLPEGACIEGPVYVDRNGLQPIKVGSLPMHLAAINRNQITMQQLAEPYIRLRAIRHLEKGRVVIFAEDPSFRVETDKQRWRHFCFDAVVH